MGLIKWSLMLFSPIPVRPTTGRERSRGYQREANRLMAEQLNVLERLSQPSAQEYDDFDEDDFDEPENLAEAREAYEVPKSYDASESGRATAEWRWNKELMQAYNNSISMAGRRNETNKDIDDWKKKWRTANPNRRRIDESVALLHEILGTHGGNSNLLHGQEEFVRARSAYEEIELFDPHTKTYRLMDQQDLLEGWDPNIAKWSTDNEFNPKIAKQLRERLRNSMSLQSGNRPWPLREYDAYIYYLGGYLDHLALAMENTKRENGSIPASMLTSISIGPTREREWSNKEIVKAQVRLRADAPMVLKILINPNMFPEKFGL